MEASVHLAREGERHAAGGSEIVIKATGDETGESFFLSESTLPPGFPGPPPHRHRQLVHMFYVLEGVLTVRLGEATREFQPGAFVCVPPGAVHTFSNASDSPVRFLNFNTPAGWENYMRDLAEAAKNGPLTPAVIGRVASNYDSIRHNFGIADSACGELPCLHRNYCTGVAIGPASRGTGARSRRGHGASALPRSGHDSAGSRDPPCLLRA
jgi:quercetin dioxygenase-like cupin family protein